MSKKQVYQTPKIEVMIVEHDSFLNTPASPGMDLPDVEDGGSAFDEQE